MTNWNPTHNTISIDGTAVPLYDSVESLNNPFYVGASTLISVIEYHLGDSFEYAKVITEESGTVRYIRIENIVLIPGTNFCVYKPVKDNLIPDTKQKDIKIQNLETSEPFYDRKYKKYSVVIDTGSTNVNLTNENGMLKSGLKEIFDFYGKNVVTDQDINSYLDYFRFVYIDGDYDYPIRPGHNVRVRVSVDSKYLNAIEDITFEAYHSLVKSSADSPGGTANILSVSFSVSQFEKKIKKLQDVLNRYHEQISQSSAYMNNLNLKRLSKRLQKFFVKFKKMLLHNGIVLDDKRDDIIEIGFDKSCFKILYAIYYGSPGIFLIKGFKKIKEFTDRKIAKALINHDQIIDSTISGTTWMQMVNDNFSGEFTIGFSAPQDIKGRKFNKNAVKDHIKNLSSQYDDNPFKSGADEAALMKIVRAEDFRKKAGQLLAQSEDFVGDNFIKNLPDIIDNIDDIKGLYTMVFDKISVKDITDLILEKATQELNIPDINEIKIRGVLKVLPYDKLLDLLSSALSGAEMDNILLKICENYEFVPDEVDDFFNTMADNIPGMDYLWPYFVNYDVDGALHGLLAENGYSGNLDARIQQVGLNNGCFDLAAKVLLKDFFQKEAFSTILCSIIQNGFPSYDVCKIDNIGTDGFSIEGLPSFNREAIVKPFFKGLKKLDKDKVRKGIDTGIKELFKKRDSTGNLEFPDIFSTFLEDKKMKAEIDKLSKAKKGFLKEIPGINLPKELSRKDVPFDLPKKKDLNPSFDFEKFQFKDIDDIFGSLSISIEDGIKSGIETALVAAFKGMLKNLLSSRKNEGSKLRSPDFGGESFSSLLNASNGTSALTLARSVLPSINNKLALDVRAGCESVPEPPGEDDVVAMLDDISNMFTPQEIYKIAKGEFNSVDYELIKSGLNPDIFNEELMSDIMAEISNNIDTSMVEELEEISQDKQVMISLCESMGVGYGDTINAGMSPPSLKSLRDTLNEKYPDEIVQQIIDNSVEDTKDAVIDAIASLKGDFQDDLSFGDDPCSLMPKPSDVPVMKFVNDMFFNSVFDSIQAQYKQDALNFPDLLLKRISGREAKKYIPLFLIDGDKVVTGVAADGFTPKESQVVGTIYNKEFAMHYNGLATMIYRGMGTSGKIAAYPTDYIDKESRINDYLLIKKMVESDGNPGTFDEIYTDFWEGAPMYGIVYPTGKALNYYIADTREFLMPVPEVHKKFKNFGSNYHIYGSDEGDYVIHSPSHGSKLEFDPDGGVRLQLPSSFAQAPDCNISSAAGYAADIPPYEIFKTEILNLFDLSSAATGTRRDMLESLLDTSEWIGEEQTLTRTNKPGYEAAEDIPEHGYIYNRLNCFLMEFIADKITNSNLFDTLQLQAFLFETDEISLLDCVQAKKEAIDDYNKSCSFKDANGDLSQQEKAAVKKVIELTIKLYLLDIIIRGCFLYHKVIKDGILNDLFFEMVYENLISGLQDLGKLYYEKFMKYLRSEYNIGKGEDAQKQKIREMVNEQYQIIVEKFSKLFKESTANVTDFLFNEEHIFFADGVSGGGTNMFAPNLGPNAGTGPHDYKNFIVSTMFVQYIYNEYFLGGKDSGKLPFMIEKIIVKDHGPPDGYTSQDDYYGDELGYWLPEHPWGGGARMDLENFGINLKNAGLLETIIGDRPAGPCKLRYRLSYFDLVGETVSVNSDDIEAFFGRGKDGEDEEGFNLANLTNPAGTRAESQRWHEDASGEMPGICHKSRAWFQRHNPATEGVCRFIKIPLMEVDLRLESQLADTDTDLIIPPDEEIADNKKVLEIMRKEARTHPIFQSALALPEFYDFILFTLIADLTKEYPDIKEAFAPTKETLKRAFDSITQSPDTFDYQDADTEKFGESSLSEVSTNPKFSKIALKMALQTVPIMLKGMAEQFDPNIKIASKIRMGADLAGVFIPPPLASLMALPMNIIPPPVGIGPPIGPLGLSYLATGFLEPAERKRLREILAGENRGSGADPSTGQPSGVELGDNLSGNVIGSDEPPITVSERAEDAIDMGRLQEYQETVTWVKNNNYKIQMQMLYEDFVREAKSLTRWLQANTSGDWAGLTGTGHYDLEPMGFETTTVQTTNLYTLHSWLKSDDKYEADPSPSLDESLSGNVLQILNSLRYDIALLAGVYDALDEKYGHNRYQGMPIASAIETTMSELDLFNSSDWSELRYYVRDLFRAWAGFQNLLSFVANRYSYIKWAKDAFYGEQDIYSLDIDPDGDSDIPHELGLYTVNTPLQIGANAQMVQTYNYALSSSFDDPTTDFFNYSTTWDTPMNPYHYSSAPAPVWQQQFDESCCEYDLMHDPGDPPNASSISSATPIGEHAGWGRPYRRYYENHYSSSDKWNILSHAGRKSFDEPDSRTNIKEFMDNVKQHIWDSTYVSNESPVRTILTWQNCTSTDFIVNGSYQDALYRVRSFMKYWYNNVKDMEIDLNDISNKLGAND